MVSSGRLGFRAREGKFRNESVEEGGGCGVGEEAGGEEVFARDEGVGVAGFDERVETVGGSEVLECERLISCTLCHCGSDTKVVAVNRWCRRKALGLTGIPLEQLIPAPLTTTTFRAFATATETSDKARLAGKSFRSVEESKWSRGKVVIGIVALLTRSPLAFVVVCLPRSAGGDVSNSPACAEDSLARKRMQDHSVALNSSQQGGEPMLCQGECGECGE